MDTTTGHAGLILAGGAGSRIGGGKPFRRLGGRPLIAHAIDRARPQAHPLWLSVPPGHADFATLGLELIPDPASPGGEHTGPLTGIAAGLGEAGRRGLPGIVTFACDTPFFPLDLAARLHAADTGSGAVAASGGRLHPVFALWPEGALPVMEQLLANGARRLHALVDETQPTVVEFPFGINGLDPFFNINTEDDLHRARDLMAAMS